MWAYVNITPTLRFVLNPNDIPTLKLNKSSSIWVFASLELDNTWDGTYEDL